MAHKWAIYRQQLVFDTAFAQELADEIAYRGSPPGTPLPPGSVLVIAAGAIVLQQDFAIPGRVPADYALVFLADSFDGGGHMIDVSGASGAAGATGAAGSDSHNFDEPGDDGAAGGNGGPGRGAGRVTIACQQLRDVRVVARGGRGGDGGRGGKGGAGERGNAPTGVQGTDGGDGGRGGDGGNGQPGGQVHLVYVQDRVPGGLNPATAIDVSGGDGGRGGDGGDGGSGGALASDGQPGPDGGAGGAGAPGTATVQQVDEPTFWQAVATIDQDAAAEWSDHRTRLGDYLFRAYRAHDPSLADNPTQAYAEFAAAIALDPSNGLAGRLQQHLVTDQNPLGLTRQYDLVPDFRRYERVMTDYGPMVLGLFETASELMANANNLGHMQDAVRSQMAHIEETVAILTTEQSAAAMGVQAAAAELGRVDGRRAQIDQVLRSRAQELERAPFDSFLRGVLGVGEMLLGFGTGASAVATVAGLAKPVWSAMTDKHLLDLSDWEKGGKARDEIGDWVGGLADIGEHSKDLISQGLVLSDIFASQADPEHKALLDEVAMLAFERQAAALRKQQADLEKAAIDQRIGQAKADIVRARQELDQLTADVRRLGDMIRTLVRRAQGYVDVILKYVFFAARALEIYALVDVSGQLSYDYGYIHPDQEEDGYRALSRGDPDKVLVLLQQYLSSWSRLPDVLYFRDSYERYSMSGQPAHDVCFVTVTDPGQLQAFQKLHELYLRVDPKQLPPSRSEDKVESVTIGLIGAAAAAPMVTCIVEHQGQWTARARGGATVDFRLPPRRAPVQALLSPAGLDALLARPADMDLGFWGRGTAATWRILIEAHETNSNNVDLSKLTAIHVALGYRSFIA
jgi:hypothetical protein